MSTSSSSATPAPRRRSTKKHFSTAARPVARWCRRRSKKCSKSSAPVIRPTAGTSMRRKPQTATITAPTAGAAWRCWAARCCRSANISPIARSPPCIRILRCAGSVIRRRFSRCFTNYFPKGGFVPEVRAMPLARLDAATPLFSGSNWDYASLRRTYDAIEDIALNELGLDVYPVQVEVITSEQMLDAYASVGLPLMYPHWSFGKRFAFHETLYRKGLQGLAYEIVINSNPCICYIMEENSMTMQTLVMAHAAFGHNHFFKNNYLFRQWTDANGILDYLSFARDYVAKCEERYGI